jgi:DNA polymerase elongation subunit (family B)
MDKSFRLFDFNINILKSSSSSSGSEEEQEYKSRIDNQAFLIQMFGINKKGETCSIIVEDFKPFFYVKVDDFWTTQIKTNFLDEIKKKIGKYYENSICDCKFVKKKKLYGFDGGKQHKFICFKFDNMPAYNKVKNLWYGKDRKLIPGGWLYGKTKTQLYEANIPPLLRFFHIMDISPSGWIALPNKKTIQINNDKKTSCTYEFRISYTHIIPLNICEDRVPYKICSFDIEASSSHGDFPVPIKSYKKLATNIIEYFEANSHALETKDKCKDVLRNILLSAFGYKNMIEIDLVYPKSPPKNQEILETLIEKWLVSPVRKLDENEGEMDLENQLKIEEIFEKMNEEEDDTGFGYHSYYTKKEKVDKKDTVIEILTNKKYARETKLNELNISLNSSFPKLQGDRVTFIGSTFLKYGDQEPYLNHCAVVNTCANVDNAVIETYKTEKDLLLAWKNLIQKENPDIIIGYNIFGFDYEFMVRRAEENYCADEFLRLSRNSDELCATLEDGRYKIEESSIQIASGQHDLKYIKMNGRIQVDMYNFFRREENLTSYKLDYVAGHFIGDYVKKYECAGGEETTVVQSANLTGLLVGSYIHFEEIGHSVDYYKDGEKFVVTHVDKTSGKFEIRGAINPDMTKKVRWCLAKDDVTPKDIFRMTNGDQNERAIIAKYCIQDCNLVHYLMNKVDVMTGYIEMSKICSVPISFLILRGQGIKLTSYVAKKCREKDTLMPVMEKTESDEGYEGAIVLDPKCDLYLDNPVACVDYASLYPSSMMSENLSHDSKVWTKEYDLDGDLIETTGEQDAEGNFIYDNLAEYEYVNITYDTYKYERKSATSAAEKIKCGYKICRFAQFPNGTRAIMPSILDELLAARKSTRKLIPQQTDEFMKNVLDKRQLGYKVTANSLYGQCGAKTSTFYEKDVAASTTATGRLLLTYAKKIIEECYGDSICQTEKYGPVLTKAEYIYGDSVANYTPVYIKTNETFDICTIEELANKYGKNTWTQCLEPGKQEKEVCELYDIQTWSEKGWTKLQRVIRHKLAPHKKMVRILTHTGMVDVTDDHSLILNSGEEISPKDVKVGTELLHFPLLEKVEQKEKPVNMNITKKKLFKSMLDATIYTNYLNSRHINFAISYFEHDICITTDELSLLHSCQVISMKEIPYEGYVYDLTTENHHFAAGIGNMIVHNTDSVFFTFNLQTPDGKPIRGKDALEITIELAQEAGHLASKFLKGPHDLEYEKTFMPFCLLSKKRYVGMLYEHDPDKGKRKEMGIVLKRRDNAPIVKDIYGGIIDILMKEKDIVKAKEFLRQCLKNIVEEKYPIEKLIITKSLRSGYKNPQQIAHKVLADRITARDPGNKPGPGDRIPFVYIHNADKKALQGEKIETPNFIRDNKIKIDYSFYITNQIMKPVQQVFALVLEKMWLMDGKKGKVDKLNMEIKKLKKTVDPEKLDDKIESLKNKEVKALLFDEFLRESNNQKEGNAVVTSFFKKK